MDRLDRKHLFEDLQPYVCTFRDCGTNMFANRRTWADHEMQVHRRIWQCKICRREQFGSDSALEAHVIRGHENLAKSQQLHMFLQTCSRPVEILTASYCNFCDWQNKLRRFKQNSDLEPQEEICVTAHQFMKHLAGHLEQLALFALPKIYVLDADSAAAGVAINSSGASSRSLVLKTISRFVDCRPSADMI